MKRLNRKSGCAVEVTLSVMGGTWKPIILFHLLHGKKRFSELSRNIGGITQRMLTLQLRELEDAGIVERTVHAEVPPRVDYALTILGHTLQPVLLAMRHWGETYAHEHLHEAAHAAPCDAQAAPEAATHAGTKSTVRTRSRRAATAAQAA